MRRCRLNPSDGIFPHNETKPFPPDRTGFPPPTGRQPADCHLNTRLIPSVCKGNSRLFPLGRKPVLLSKRHFVRLIRAASTEYKNTA
ncbi:hypothetical protein C4H39_02080 [Neisseria gonorrhoeae]|uniref:Uncharacterized protein n=1 Tax=Neisseria gonorrhoeae (strain NCCP11945) TaxID=521006 RepID=B4RQU1_NEIG2|nr:Conserved hypothetical protein [Neisseria gonorrhoeae NCCP11945]AVH82897.1 hypothetical protein A6J46_01550 [Neisseria gonorrhoeae]EEZ53728.1 predicted protein [Neisseria gonorrhoeae PID332]KMY26214.1 hypothetical protein NGDG_01852 [Neisseria gonorrhoeae FA6140]KDN01021.1 hypothetical protein BK61_06380 [Neisseria gonorrhoeae]